MPGRCMKDNGVVNSTGLGFGVLGPLEMTVGGTPVPVGAAKQRAVLAMLLMNRNSPVGVERLITGVWEGWPPSGARASTVPQGSTIMLRP